VAGDSWELFLEYAAFARAKPTFDVEEREQPLAVAGAVRAVLDTAGGTPDWLASLVEALSLAQFTDLAFFKQHRWLRRWAESEHDSLEATLCGLMTESVPLRRFAAFERAAEQATASGRLEPNPNRLLAFGSLFNFALAPGELPFVRRARFAALEAMLGFGHASFASVTAEYEHHLGFASTVRERLGEAGVPTVDMLDVQALIFNASLHVDFWGPGRRQAPADGRDREWDSTLPYVSVCAIYRDEAPYLREWIEFHRLVGVERFFLYDNLSSDGHRDVLEPYVEQGIVVVHDWPLYPGQVEAYGHCVAEHRDDSRWIAFIDIDEYLFSPTGRPLPDVLRDYEDFPGVGVNWALFGPSGHVTKPPGTVVENYVWRLDMRIGRAVKSVVNPRRAIDCKVHMFRFDHLSTVDENGYPIGRNWTKSPSYERLRVNHYFTKSVEEYRERRARPDVSAWTRTAAIPTDPPGERDEAILRYLPELRAALAGH